MTEVFTLNISLFFGGYFDPNEPWERTVEVPEHFTLFDLHHFIQEIIEFDNDHLFDFYAGSNWRHRKIKFAEEPGNPFEGREYEDVALKDIYPLKNMKLYYLFDYGDSWYFEIKKGRKKKYMEEGVEYPRVIEAVGENPSQYPDWEDDDDEDDDD